MAVLIAGKLKRTLEKTGAPMALPSELQLFMVRKACNFPSINSHGYEFPLEMCCINKNKLLSRKQSNLNLIIKTKNKEKVWSGFVRHNLCLFCTDLAGIWPRIELGAHFIVFYYRKDAALALQQYIIAIRRLWNVARSASVQLLWNISK